MIHGIGIDIVEIERMQRIYERYKERCYTRILHKDEYIYIPKKDIYTFLASRFAIKEACVKALGTGFRHGISFQDIIIHKNTSGMPYIHLIGKALIYYKEAHILSSSISLSHEKKYTVAMVIFEK